MKNDTSKLAGKWFWKAPQLSRRLFFRHLTSAVGGYFLLPTRPMETVARAAATPINTVKNVIFILMSGGPSHMDTFDLKEGPWTPANLEPTSYGDIRWPRGLFPRIADQLESVALVRSMRSYVAVHDLGRNWLQIGRNPVSGLARIAPHIGSVVSLELSRKDAVLPAFVSLNTGNGPGSGYLLPQHSPFYVSPGGGGLGNTAHRDGQAAFDRRYNLLRDLETGVDPAADLGGIAPDMASFNLSARRMMYNPDVDRIFTFDAAERARYGPSGFGNACITARNLLRAGLGTRFIQITIGGWDNHTDIYTTALNPANVNSVGRQFDNGVGTLIADLRNDNLLDDTLVLCMGEFGRTIGTLNNQRGRDHFLQQAMMVAGGKVRGGRALGSSDAQGRDVAEAGWSKNRAMRAEDVEATIYSALGIDWTTIRRDDPLGRGFEYVPQTNGPDYYAPIHELWT